eukprot:Gb_38402 [translate_table: standard]
MAVTMTNIVVVERSIDEHSNTNLTENVQGDDMEQPQMLDIQSSSILHQQFKPVTLKFQDIGYSVKLKPKSGWWNFNQFCKPRKEKTTEKTILNGITGMVCPGEILAMLGPSGSGKSTLLNALGGRLKGKVSGTLLINGQRFRKPMKRMMGFITQDDILYPHLTVRETLIYAALLRLPNTLTKHEKVQQAESIIAELGLTKCRDTIIGGHFVGGVSGGERKRVSIGHEMLLNPSLLLLDEPTSGLDSTTAHRTLLTLHNLARRGRTIVTTIHQPSSRLYHMFHKVIVLSEGSCIYYGQASEVMDYFSSIGFSPAFAMNPADFLLDLSNGITPDIKPISSTLLQPDWQSVQFEVQASVRQSLIAAFHKNLAAKVKMEINFDQTANGQSHPKSQRVEEKWTTSWYEQFSVLLERSLKERRYESFGGLRIFQVVSSSILTGLLWWQSKPYRIEDQVGLLFSLTVFWAYFPVINAVFTFQQERIMLGKERSSGMYRLSSYFAARTAGDLPMELILPTIFVVIAYWMAGLKPNAVTFILTLLVLLYTVLVSQGIGLVFGAAILDVKQATTLASVTMLTFVLVGGYYLRTIPAFVAWVKYLSPTYYCYRLLLGVQYTSDQMYHCGSAQSCRVSDLDDVSHSGLLLDVVALGVMLVGYRLIAYALLRGIKTQPQ